MIRWSTPTQPVVVRNADLVSYGCRVQVTMRQGDVRLDIDDPPMTYDPETGDTTLLVSLTQEQTAAFGTGYAEVQVNAVDWNGYRIPTDKVRVHMGSNLLDEEMMGNG